MLHLLSITGINLLFLSLSQLSCRKNRPIVLRYQGTMGHWVGHNKYIETLRILLHLIFIFYLILQINKNILSDLQQNSCFSCTVCATTDSRGSQNQTHITRCHYHYCLKRKMFLYFHFRGTFINKRTLVTCITAFRVDFFL